MNLKSLLPFDQIPPYGFVFNNDTGERITQFVQFRDCFMYIIVLIDRRIK